MIWKRFCQLCSAVLFAFALVCIGTGLYAALRGDGYIGLMLMICAVFCGGLGQGMAYAATR